MDNFEYNDYSNYSNQGFEGVYSQSWREKGNDDSVWQKLNELKKDLVRFLRKHPDQFEFQKNCTFAIRERVLWLLNLFMNSKKPIGILTRSKWGNVLLDEKLGVRLKEDIEIYNLIGKEKRGRMLALLCRIFVNINSNDFATKRELYYRDKKIYEKQANCDSSIEDLCCITHYSRKELHILSCPKGSIYGRIEYKLDNITYNCMDYKYGLTISPDMNEMQEIKTDARFILVIEKDATFQHLLTRRVVDKFPAILITGKGFPDAETRRCVKFLSTKLKIPVLGLVDCNPWGLEIFCIYRFGSLAMAHDAMHCTVMPSKWLGLLPTDLVKFNISIDQTEELNERDLAKINSLKRRPYITQNKALLDELEFMLKNNRKAELQALVNVVETYLPIKIKEGSWK
ncbi:meiotic recombination protein SPO11-like [Panonychus citri]|uniref:meiotic recombination protein SPO11-like n=1 Tax=Panonychus citri TaxID=50023 RepID=UPI00230747AB|nr:meiotic recombination protein SPO11-like [Panonychus citri]